MRNLGFLALLALLCAACTRDPDASWSNDQKAVHAAMQAWSAAASKHDTDAMWKLLSPDAQDIYLRELTGKDGLREQVRLIKASLAPEARTTPEQRRKNEEFLKALPENPGEMTVEQYYAWRTKRELTPEKTENTARLFEKGNIADMTFSGSIATVVLERGEPSRYLWKKVGGDWKFDLHPSILRELEDVRRREADAK